MSEQDKTRLKTKVNFIALMSMNPTRAMGIINNECENLDNNEVFLTELYNKINVVCPLSNIHTLQNIYHIIKDTEHKFSGYDAIVESLCKNNELYDLEDDSSESV